MALEITTTMLQALDARVALTAPSSQPEVSTINIAQLSPTPPKLDSFTLLHSVLLLDPGCITDDFDKLRFEAAAHDQLMIRNEQPLQTCASTSKLHLSNQEIKKATSTSPPKSSSTLLISSPYNIPSHYLTLTSPHLTTPSILLALALTTLKPATPTYATAPYTSALNFDVVLAVLRDVTAKEDYVWQATSFYVVTFHSQLKEAIDEDYLYELDRESHREACESGGLLKYWFGKKDGERRNLATCKYCWRRVSFIGRFAALLFVAGL
jgi:hypothetical protein